MNNENWKSLLRDLQSESSRWKSQLSEMPQDFLNGEMKKTEKYPFHVIEGDGGQKVTVNFKFDWKKYYKVWLLYYDTLFLTVGLFLIETIREKCGEMWDTPPDF